MVLWEAKGFGGEEEVELLWEPWGKGLLDRFEGLVLPGLGLAAMSSFVRQCGWAAVVETKAATEAAATRWGSSRPMQCGEQKRVCERRMKDEGMRRVRRGG